MLEANRDAAKGTLVREEGFEISHEHIAFVLVSNAIRECDGQKAKVGHREIYHAADDGEDEIGRMDGIVVIDHAQYAERDGEEQREAEPKPPRPTPHLIKPFHTET